MKNEIVYDVYSASEYCEALQRNELNNSESVYYLLKKRLNKALLRVYQLHGFGLCDEFEDTVDDYFLYLYDWDPMGLQRPFAIMEGVRNKSAFFGWVVGTYRNFLLNKAREEEKRARLLEDARVLFHDNERPYNDDALVHMLATAIAYADQLFLPRNLFVCYRMLLSLLDHTRAIPQERMALALDMHPVTYRVCSKRQKDKLGDFILLQETGHLLDLDAAHLLMRDRLVEGFNHWYDLLLEFYDKSLEQLPSAGKIRVLRQEYGRSNGTTMHEDVRYGSDGIKDFALIFNALKTMG